MTDQALSTAFFANRRRTISAAAAAPNRITIGGAGTGVGLPLLFPLLPCDEPPRLELQPWLELQPFDDEP